MTNAQACRRECLLQLYGSGSIPISIAHIRKVAAREQLVFSEEEVRNALHFHKGQGFCDEVTNAGSGEPRYVINSKGMIEHERSDS